MNVPTQLAPLVRGVHHIAIVVPSIAEARQTYEGVFALAASEQEFVADQRVNVLVMYAGAQRIELVEPASSDSPVSKFLAKTGGGLHHVAYKVDDVAAALGVLKAAGLRLIDETPRPGAHGTTVAFVHPAATGGVLTELVQDAEHGPDAARGR
ncbi:MAG: methylmalonyl-CoA epimerase [Planctomycetes bacterium]|nr:methylmalonyl-CoA epimerase [Planctomycetota bacterium]